MEWLSETSSCLKWLHALLERMGWLVGWISSRKGGNMDMGKIHRTTVIEVFHPGSDTCCVRFLQKVRK